MNRCPHGDHELLVPVRAEHNVLTYGDSALVVTDCCSQFVRIGRVQSIWARTPSAAELRRKDDDWGARPARKEKRA